MPQKRTRKERRQAQRQRRIPSPQISYWMVAFLDLLGYRHVLEDLDVVPLPTADADVARLTAALARATRIRRRLHVSFRQFLAGQQLAEFPELGEIPSHLQGLVQSLRAIKLIDSPGPDHFILAASLAPSPANFPMRAVYSAVMATAAGMLIQLATGADDPSETLPIRGGIDIAAGAVVAPEDFLYSPALSRAYELESGAVYPRTLVGERVQSLLRSVAALTESDLASHHAREVAARVQSMFFTDVDGKLAVDFYGPIVRETIGADLARTLGQRAWAYAIAAERVAREKGISRVTEKYEWLVRYMSERRQLWQ